MTETECRVFQVNRSQVSGNVRLLLNIHASPHSHVMRVILSVCRPLQLAQDQDCSKRETLPKETERRQLQPFSLQLPFSLFLGLESTKSQYRQTPSSHMFQRRNDSGKRSNRGMVHRVSDVLAGGWQRLVNIAQALLRQRDEDETCCDRLELWSVHDEAGTKGSERSARAFSSLSKPLDPVRFTRTSFLSSSILVLLTLTGIQNAHR